MCVTLTSAHLSNTLIYAAAVEHQGSLAHVLAYQNQAASDSPNAMILPIPTNEELGESNIIDTQKARWFLKDMAAPAVMYRGGTKGGRDLVLGSSSYVKVFDSGSYTVVIASDATAIPEALERVAENRRPIINNPGFFEEYGKLYPGWPIAVCCWSGKIEAEPLLMWYRPKFPEEVFFPTVDAHDGSAPRNQEVKRDHTLILGTSRGSYNPRFRSPLPSEIAPFITDRVLTSKPNGYMKNGDYWIREGGMFKVRFPGEES